MNFTDEHTEIKDLITISNYLPRLGIEEVRAEIFKGLKSGKKYISCKYFYDETGSKLFEKITGLKEYYLTRTEKSILNSAALQIMDHLSNYSIVELGSGDCSKISILLDAVHKDHVKTIEYIPVDLSQSAIEKSAGLLSEKYPLIKIYGIVADFIKQLPLIPKATNRLFCFFGSTIGNLNRKQSLEFIKDLSGNMLTGDQLLLGLDMVKSKPVLENAYNDSKQVTAEFNKNILNVVNNLAGTDFNMQDFEHLAFFNEEEARIEMHLKAKRNIKVNCSYTNEKIIIYEDDYIHTENSYKFTKNHITDFGAYSGLKINKIFSDAENWFSLVHMIK